MAEATKAAILYTKDQQDRRDFATILKERETHKAAFSIKDILDCNRLPLLNTRVSAPATKSAAYEIFQLGRDWGMNDPSNLNSHSMSQVGSSIKSALGGAYRGLSIRQENSRLIPSAKEKEDTNERLSRVLKYITDAKEIIDSSRLYFEAAVNFQFMEMFERAAYCYRKSTLRVSAALVVDTYDLPEDEKYKRHLERMSKFQQPQFLRERAEYRDQLIFAEEERQRLRARESHFQLVRIHLLTDLVDLKRAHGDLAAAFRCCANDLEHRDMLLSMHVLLKEFAVRTSCPPATCVSPHHLCFYCICSYYICLLSVSCMVVYAWCVVSRRACSGGSCRW
jgi:hypothetical protein